MPTQPAILGTMRLGNFRLGYEPAALAAIRLTRVRITLGGVDAQSLTAATRIRKDGLTIHDVINETPNTCSLTADGVTPSAESVLQISINSDAPRVLFHGNLQTVGQSYDGTTLNVIWPCSAIDDGDQANRKRPFGTWTAVSATTIAQYLVTTYAPSFSTAGIVASLPAVSVNLDGSEGMNGAFAQLAKLIGGYFKFENGIAYLFQTDTTDQPSPIDVSHPFLNDPPITSRLDTSQLRTRVYGKGHGEPLLSDVVVGETTLPVANVTAWYNAGGGKVQAGTEVLTYTGKTQASPTTALAARYSTGAGIDDGSKQWVYTFVTGSGETTPSVLSAALVMETLATGPAIASIAALPGSGPNAGTTISYALAVIKDLSQFQTYGTVTGLSDLGATTVQVAPGGEYYRVAFSATAGLSGRCIGLFRSDSGGGGSALWYLMASVVFSVSSGMIYLYDNWFHNSSIGGAFYDGSTGHNQVNRADLYTIPVGPAGTTQRKIYRNTTADQVTFKLQQTIADNTSTTGVTDSTADASLGAAAPSSDTSGLVLNAVSTTSGSTAAGATSLVLVSGTAFLAVGGWVMVAGIPVRYTGKSTNTLTGVPATGAGSITAAIPSATVVSSLPTLLGVPSSGTGSVTSALTAGTLVNLWVQRDNLSAQATQAAIDAINGMTPADGIYEGPPIVDERRNETSLTALCDATLSLYASPIQTVTYATRDVKSKSGKTVHIALTAPAIGPVDLTIQDVTITEIDIIDGLAPRFSVTASTVRHSLEDFLRQLLAVA